MAQRGAALPTVLALVSAVLVMGLAMGSLSTLSLQFNRRQLEGMRAEMAARSGLAHLLAKLRQHDVGSKLNPLKPEPSNVADLFPQGLTVKEGSHQVTVHFNPSQEGYSSDNLAGDEPAVGWPDSDDVPRVQPFGLDVVLNVEGPSSSHRFRVGLRRVWPYALYTTRGPIVLMGQPTDADTSAQPSLVKGDAFTSWVGNAANGGTEVTGYGLGQLNTPSKMLAHMEARAGYHPSAKPAHPLIVGMRLGENPPLLPDEVHDASSGDEHFYYIDDDAAMPDYNSVAGDPTFGVQPPELLNGRNVMNGDFLYDHDLEVDVEPVEVPVLGAENEFLGRSVKRRALAPDPLQDITEGSGAPASTFDSAGFQELDLHPAGEEMRTLYGLDLDPDPETVHLDEVNGQAPFFLPDDLVLTETENSTGGAVSTHYVVKGSLTNREVVYYDGSMAEGPGLYVREKRVGMHLQNTVLHVEGDLDLGASGFDGTDPEERIPIVGAGATLIVDGQLILGNAAINGQDQGFVMYARDIVLKGGGNFFGLMIAENSITILSQDEEPLKIQGALLCGGRGGITLRGAELEHDPEYLKSINGGGDFAIVSWSKL